MRALVVVLLLVATSAHADPPILASPSVVAIDAATGAELYAKHADDVRPIASMTKLFAALALRGRRVDLAKSTTIDFDDAKASVGGAGTLLLEGERFKNADLFAAMMLASDNRVPSALARSAGWSIEDLRTAMTHVASDLGLAHTRFDDTTGIAGNASTAREMALAVRAAVADRVLARFMTMRHATVVSESGAITAHYTSTVAPLWDDRFTIRGGKTGHTGAAGYCLVIVARIGRRDVAMAFLGGAEPGARFDDFAKLAQFLANPRT